jgi:hypothetical protein
MFKSPFIILAALGVISLGGYFIHLAFKSADTAGLEKGRKECVSNQNTAMGEAMKDKEVIQNEEQKLSDADILDALIAIGIVRTDSDR